MIDPRAKRASIRERPLISNKKVTGQAYTRDHEMQNTEFLEKSTCPLTAQNQPQESARGFSKNLLVMHYLSCIAAGAHLPCHEII